MKAERDTNKLKEIAKENLENATKRLCARVMLGHDSSLCAQLKGYLMDYTIRNPNYSIILLEDLAKKVKIFKALEDLCD
jgi:hypothetical protein